jgi:hypothetical protein
MNLDPHGILSLDHEERDWANVIRRALFDLDGERQSTGTVLLLAARMEAFADELRRSVQTPTPLSSTCTHNNTTVGDYRVDDDGRVRCAICGAVWVEADGSWTRPLPEGEER